MTQLKKIDIEEGLFGTAVKGTGKVLAASNQYIAVASLLMKAYQFVKQYATKEARACNDLQGPEKGICKTDMQIEGLKYALSALTVGRPKCDRSKDPGKCREKLEHHIDKVQIKMEKLVAQNESYKKQKMIADKQKRLTAERV